MNGRIIREYVGTGLVAETKYLLESLVDLRYRADGGEILMRTAPAPVLEVTAAQRTAVEAALRRRDLAPRLRERLEMVKAAALGQDLAAIARWSGRTPETVRRWLAAYQAGGIAALADAPRQGRPPKADAAYLAALEAAVETPPRTLGLPFDVWTSASPQRLSHAADRGAHRPWLAARAAAPAALRLRSAQTHARPSARPGRKSPPVQEALRVAGEKGAGSAGAVRTAL